MNKKLILIGALVFLGGIYYFSNGTKPIGQTPINSQTRAVAPTQTVELKDGDTYTLTASIVKKNLIGQEVKMLAYNGSIPAPTIKVPQGAEITLNLINDTDTPTALHSHGVRLDNQYDGVVPDTQKEIPVGGSFQYKIKFPDAGVFWYHPHLNEVYGQNLGLYGNFLVTPKDPNYYSPVNREIPVTLSDVRIENGTLSIPEEPAVNTLMGRYGNQMLTNGQTDYSLNVTKGEVIRFDFTNTANARPFNIVIGGVKMKLVGSDNGKYEREKFVKNVIISPSERYIVEAYFPTAGKYNLESDTPSGKYILGTINVADGQLTDSYKKEFETLRINKDVISDIDTFRNYFDKADDKSIKLSVDMKGMGSVNMGGHNMGMMDGGMMGDDGQKIEWEDTMSMMSEMSNTKNLTWQITDTDTGLINDKINWNFNKGDKIKIKIFNDPKGIHPMQHPIHFHGQRFLVLSTNGIKNDDLVWKDTTLVQKGDTVEILVDMSNPGIWMAHCHISEHLEANMMFHFKVNE